MPPTPAGSRRPQEWSTNAGRPGWKGYYTGAVSTRGKRSFQGPARLCVSARLPGDSSAAARATGSNIGLWPAIWLMPVHANDFDQSLGCWPDLGEIDLAEMVNGDPSWYAAARSLHPYGNLGSQAVHVLEDSP